MSFSGTQAPRPLPEGHDLADEEERGGDHNRDPGSLGPGSAIPSPPRGNATTLGLDIFRIHSYSIRMTTTIHLPPELLRRVDERARGLKVSRNQYIRRALERMVQEETRWSGDFLDALDQAAADEESHDAVDEMMRGTARRSRKRPPRL